MPQQEQFQPQQFMQQPQQNAVQMYGRIVPTQECIAPNEVPMDGQHSILSQAGFVGDLC